MLVSIQKSREEKLLNSMIWMRNIVFKWIVRYTHNTPHPTLAYPPHHFVISVSEY
jgi:hypothetical protein